MPRNERSAALITGAGGGIGAPTSTALAERGFRVYAGVRTEAASIPDHPGIVPVRLDVTDPASISAAVHMITDERGEQGLQVLVNNAGVIVQGPLELLSDEELRRQFEINVAGPHRVLKGFLPLLRAGAGRVINISAPTAQLTMPYLAPISASKAALESLSHAARVELAQFRIPVSIVSPGAVDTPIFTRADEDQQKMLAKADPEILRLYRARLADLAAAAQNQRLGAVEPVIKTIVRAATARQPKPYYPATGEVRAALLLSRLPLRLRDRLVSRLLGLSAVAPAS